MKTDQLTYSFLSLRDKLHRSALKILKNDEDAKDALQDTFFINLALAVNDPFGWNITKSKAYYRDYVVSTRNDIHSHAVSFRVSWSFGRNKVNNVYRDSKERESKRSN
ncbi:MAG: hypothetical protein K2J82_07595 [Muribaculaceae bacterium]|nr:hypothetical protein [Muribaculaceae bacterium]MDE6754460.1 hypothetical protein [Muribaculaceae bacterium]